MAFQHPREVRAPPSGGGVRDEIGENIERAHSCWSGEEEVLASNEGSEEDRQFDVIVGTLEEAVMDPSFASVQQTFVDEWCGEFSDAEENMLIYTDLFRQYTQLVERHLDSWLRERIPSFNMETFMKTVTEREDEIIGDVFDMLVAMGDFGEFKQMMLSQRAGRSCGMKEVTSRFERQPGLRNGRDQCENAAHSGAERLGIYSGERKN